MCMFCFGSYTLARRRFSRIFIIVMNGQKNVMLLDFGLSAYVNIHKCVWVRASAHFDMSMPLKIAQ